MVDAVAAALAGAGGNGEGEGGAGGGAAGGGGDSGAGAGGAEGLEYPAWMQGLPDELRADPDLNRYKTTEDLAKGLKETRAWARGRIPLPAADDDAAWRELGEKLRPAKPEEYEIAVPEGQDAGRAERFKAFAHDTGIPARWAKAIADFDAREMADAVSAVQAKAQGEIQAIELELGAEAYNRRLEAVGQMFEALGVKDVPDVATGLQQTMGADKALRFLFAVAEKTGELDKVDPTGVAMRMGAMTPDRAQAQIDQLSNDRAFMQQAMQPGTAENRKWNELNAAAAKGR